MGDTKTADDIPVQDGSREGSWRWVALALTAVMSVSLSPLAKVIVPEFVVFHTVLEFICIVACLMIFTVQFVLRSKASFGRFQLLGIPFLGIALLDLVHTLSYRGLPALVTENSPQKSIAFWLAARFLEAMTVVAFAIVSRLRFEVKVRASVLYIIVLLYAACSLWWVLLSPETVPVFADTAGRINDLKIGIEYFFILAHLFTAAVLLSLPQGGDQRTADLSTASLILAVSGLCFSSFSDGHDLVIFLGHLLKVLAYYFVFRSCLVNELLSPYAKVLQLSDELQKQSQNMREMQRRLQRAERLGILGQSLAGVVHDLNNMLVVTEWSAEKIVRLVSAEGAAEDVRRYSESILASLSKTKNFQRLLLEKARGVPTNRAVDIDLFEEMEHLAPLLRSMAGVENRLEIACQPGARIFSDPFHLEQVIMNLVVNARDALIGRDNRAIVITIEKEKEYAGVPTATGPLPAGRYVTIAVRDTGSGIAAELLPKVFQPFFTTKESNRGTGLGLSTVKDVVDSWGGFIAIQSTLGQGTEFVIFVPSKMNEDRKAE
ncbi:MAG: hypothetical protein IPJ84_11175 [Bdellovibrionales bacterium]|nr:hypothetical protein [Bdellovibrionales bacterium]